MAKRKLTRLAFLCLCAPGISGMAADWGEYRLQPEPIQNASGVFGQLRWRAGSSFPYGAMREKLSLQIRFVSASTLRVRITDEEKERYEVQGVTQASAFPVQAPSAAALAYNVSYEANPFSMQVMRRLAFIFCVSQSLIFLSRLFSCFFVGSKSLLCCRSSFRRCGE